MKMIEKSEGYGLPFFGRLKMPTHVSAVLCLVLKRVPVLETEHRHILGWQVGLAL